ncbi:DUF975 family protein [Pseudobutyrivibrio sp.]
MFPRKEIKANSRAALKANYWSVIGILFLGSILSGLVVGCASIPGTIAQTTATLAGEVYIPETSLFTSCLYIVGVLLALIFEVGIARFAYRVYRGDAPELGDLFVAFKDGNFGRVLGGMILVTIYTFLWSLLLIIPGIIKGYQYSMMPYLLIDRPDLSIKECFAMSKKMTSGFKWSIFVLELSFIGWAILSVFTLGILDIFFVTPYMSLALGGTYDYLKRTRMEDGVSATEQAVEGEF